MNSYAKLIETHMISFKEVLVLNYKNIGLNEVEAIVLILLYEQKKHTNNAISIKGISKYVTFDDNELSKIIVKLVENGYIDLILENNIEHYSLKPTIDKLGDALERLDKSNSDKDYKEEIQLIIADLEKFYGRPLKPNELLIIQNWLNDNFSIEIIKSAVDESIKLNKKNVKYIDCILNNRKERPEVEEVDSELEEVLKNINVRR